jgi:hypothetical protein
VLALILVLSFPVLAGVGALAFDAAALALAKQTLQLRADAAALAGAGAGLAAQPPYMWQLEQTRLDVGAAQAAANRFAVENMPHPIWPETLRDEVTIVDRPRRVTVSSEAEVRLLLLRGVMLRAVGEATSDWDFDAWRMRARLVR